jgi:hypothetical protein
MGATPRSDALTPEAPSPPLSASASAAAPSAIEGPYTGSEVWQEDLPGRACPPWSYGGVRMPMSLQ